MPVVGLSYGAFSAVTDVASYAELAREVAETFEVVGRCGGRIDFRLLDGKKRTIDSEEDFQEFADLAATCRVLIDDGFPRLDIVRAGDPSPEAVASPPVQSMPHPAAATPPAKPVLASSPAVSAAHVTDVHSSTQALGRPTATVTETVEADSTPQLTPLQPPIAAAAAPPPPQTPAAPQLASEAAPAVAAPANVAAPPAAAGAAQATPPPPPPAPLVGSLEITVVSAKGLADKDGIGQSDPYCLVELEGFKAQQTPVIDGTAEPVWDYVASYDLNNQAKSLALKLAVFDSDPVGSDHLGTCEVVLSKQMLEKALGEPVKMSSQLKDEAGKVGAGVIQFRLSAIAGEPPPPAAAPAQGAAALPREEKEKKPPADFVCPDVMEVTVVKAIDLVDRDGIGESDPYVSIEMDSHPTSTSPVIDGTLRPVWDYQVTYDLQGKADHLLKLTVFDSDPVGSDFLGYAEVKVTPNLLSKSAKSPQKLAVHLSGRPGNTEDEAWVRENGGASKQGKIFATISAFSALGSGQQVDTANRAVKAKAGPPPDLLSLVVVKGTNLASMDTFGSSDPYVVVEAPGFPQQQTPVVNGTLDPVWTHLMSYDLPAEPTYPIPFKVSVYDSDIKGQDLIGTAMLEVTEAHLYAVLGKKKQFALNLMRDGEKQGRLFVSLDSMRSSAGKPEGGKVVGPCPDLMEITVQRATSLVDRDSFGESDPFVSMTIKGYPDYQTPVVDGTLSPEWNYKALYELKGKDQHLLQLTVHDSDPVGADFLGHADIQITPHMLRRAVKKPQSLSAKLGPRPGNASDSEWVKSLKGAQLGRVFVSLSAIPRAPSSKTGSPKWWCIHVVKATGLSDTDTLGKSDPYVVLGVEGQKDQGTGVADGTLDPVWVEEFAVELCLGEVVRFTVMDSDTAGADFLGAATLLLTDAFLQAGEGGSKVTMNLKPRAGNKKDAKFAKKRDGNLGQLHVTVTPSVSNARAVKQEAADKAAKAEKAAKKPAPKKPAPKPATPPAAKPPPPAAPPTTPPLPAAVPRGEPPAEQLPDAESEALKMLLDINPMARSQAALLVGKEWKNWSWQQRLVVARQVELGLAPDASFLVAPMRASYKSALSSDASLISACEDDEERSLEARFERLWGTGPKPRPPSPSHIDRIVAERKRQALRDLEEERLARRQLEKSGALMTIVKTPFIVVGKLISLFLLMAFVMAFVKTNMCLITSIESTFFRPDLEVSVVETFISSMGACIVNGTI